MANLNLLREVGEELVPLVKSLIALAAKDKNADMDDRVRAKHVIDKLEKVVAKANVPTSADFAARSNVIYATRHAVMILLIEAASCQGVGLSKAQIRILEAQATTLRDAHGHLLEMKVFEDIARLLPESYIRTISEQLEGAKAEIASRERARDVLNLTVTAIITAAKIAARVV